MQKKNPKLMNFKKVDQISINAGFNYTTNVKKNVLGYEQITRNSIVLQ